MLVCASNHRIRLRSGSISNRSVTLPGRSLRSSSGKEKKLTTIEFNCLRALAVSLSIPVLAWYGSALGQASAKHKIDPAVAKLGKGFVSNTANLLHGSPQDWYEFHQIMPCLAKNFTAIDVDLRGVGGSAATPGGFTLPVTISVVWSCMPARLYS